MSQQSANGPRIAVIGGGSQFAIGLSESLVDYGRDLLVGAHVVLLDIRPDNLRIVEDYVIYPRLIGRDIHLHPLVVILAVLVPMVPLAVFILMPFFEQISRALPQYTLETAPRPDVVSVGAEITELMREITA